MANSGGFALSRNRGLDRFYNPPAIRRNKQLMLQRQVQRPPVMENRGEFDEAENRTDSDESTLSGSNSGCSPSVHEQPCLTNLDRVMDAVTPFVAAQYFSEVRGRRTHEADRQPFFCLGDLWESYREWSVYGVGVPLVLNGSDSVKQYYVPSLSGIQLYIDPTRLRLAVDSDTESSRETSSGGSSDCEVERQSNGFSDNMWGQHNLMNSNSKRMSNLTLRDKPPTSSSSDEPEVRNSPGKVVFEYLEQEQPHFRKPLFDKVTNLSSQCPELSMYRSYDLLPSSWISVAWYPIYRIPVGQTLQNLDASFLTFHCLSTHSKGKGQPQCHASSPRRAHAIDSSTKISLPVFGLASYKLGNSMLITSGDYEGQQSSSLLQSANDWLRNLQVNHPDFQFFTSHNSQWR